MQRGDKRRGGAAGGGGVTSTIMAVHATLRDDTDIWPFFAGVKMPAPDLLS